MITEMRASYDALARAMRPDAKGDDENNFLYGNEQRECPEKGSEESFVYGNERRLVQGEVRRKCNTEFWNGVRRIATKVNQWPAWKRQGIAKRPE